MSSRHQGDDPSQHDEPRAEAYKGPLEQLVGATFDVTIAGADTNPRVEKMELKSVILDPPPPVRDYAARIGARRIENVLVEFAESGHYRMNNQEFEATLQTYTEMVLEEIEAEAKQRAAETTST